MSEIQQGLLIAAIGMGLVFAVILFLWGLMALMMRLTSSSKSEEDQPTALKTTDAALVPNFENIERKNRIVAAAVAVQFALSAKKTVVTTETVGEQSPGVSAWQSYHRSRQLENRNKRG